MKFKSFALVMIVIAVLAVAAGALADGTPPPTITGPTPQGQISSSDPGVSGMTVPDCLTQSISWRTLARSHGLVMRFTSVQNCAGKLSNGTPMKMRLQHAGQPVYVTYTGCATFTVRTPRGVHYCP